MSSDLHDTAEASSAITATEAWTGQRLKRKEDRRLLKGQGKFVDDVKRYGMGYLHFVRSPYAHARIVSVDVSQAEALPGVYGTLTGREAADLTDPYWQVAPGDASAITEYCLAVDKACWAGHPVAAVVAATREIACDAAELVEVEYEPLDPLMDARKATENDAPIVHEDAGTNVVLSALFDYGDVDAALRDADHVLRISELYFHRFSSTPLECSGSVAEFDAGTGEFTVTCNLHGPGPSITWISGALRVPAAKLHLITGDIGGGFGNKLTGYTYVTAACLLARKLGRPVKWTEWRTEQQTANAHGADRWFQDIEVAVAKDGTLLGFSAKAIDDVGAFPRYEPTGAVLWTQVTPGCYLWRNIRVDMRQVITNKTPSSANRGYSRMQHLWLTERIIDIVSHELGFDPVEIRKRNYIPATDFPYETPSGGIYDSGDYTQSLDIALELADYDRFRTQRGIRNNGKLLGIGIGSTLDSGTQNYAQVRLANPHIPVSGNNQVATIKLDLSGEVVLSLGSAPQGQGHETTAAQVAADILGVTPDDVVVHSGHDSRRNTHAGWSGTNASQFAVTGLGATKGAAEKLAAEIRLLAGAVLGAPAAEIVLAKGAALAPHGGSLTFFELASLVNVDNLDYPADLDVTLNCRYVYRPPFALPDVERKFGNLTLTYASQVHLAVIEIDPDTGAIEILRYVAVDDCGVRVNPMIVEGQVHGALAHGLGAALTESYEYDEHGQLLTSNFYQYHVPTALDMPDLHTGEVVTPSPFGPVGAKGMGEGGGAGLHTISAAVQDALRAAGIRAVVHESFNDPQRVWSLIHEPEASQRRVIVESR